MPKARKEKSRKEKAARKVPPWGRSEREIEKESSGPSDFAADVPIGNTDPTVVHGVLEGGMPRGSGAAKGRLKTQRGKRT